MATDPDKDRGRPRRLAIAGLTAASFATALAGCASNRVEVGHRTDPAARFTKGDGYALATPAGPADAALEPKLAQRLAALGYVARPPAAARLYVEIGQAERPVDVGAYAVSNPPEPKTSGWLAEPQRRPWWASRKARACTLEIRILDMATSAELYRARASTRHRKPPCADTQDRLLDAALSGLAAPTP